MKSQRPEFPVSFFAPAPLSTNCETGKIYNLNCRTRLVRDPEHPGCAQSAFGAAEKKRCTMAVYGDILFAENFIIGCALIYITAEVFGVDLHGAAAKLRLAAGGAMCGLFAMLIFLPVRMPLTAVVEAAFAFLLSVVVFGIKGAWKKALVLILVTYFMGGITMGLLLVTGNTGMYAATGIYTGDMKAAMLAVFICTGTFTAKQIIRAVSKKKFYSEHVFDVRIISGGIIVETRGFFDSGNQLTDPVSGMAVAIAQESLWERLENAGLVTPERSRLIPYDAIGAHGLLEAVRVDDVESAGRHLGNTIIARAGCGFGLSGRDLEGCELLLSREMHSISEAAKSGLGMTGEEPAGTGQQKGWVG